MDSGFAIAIAWPKTLCKRAGGWYDRPMSWMGFSKKGYYKVGHAAVVLISDDSLVCNYYDFGRYHAPYQYGRIRSGATDFDLKITVKPEIDFKTKTLKNTTQILKELQSNESCHGDGKIYASVTRVNFESANNKAIEMQNREFIPYGPFIYKGSNCSRFVNSVLLAGKLSLWQNFKMRFPLMLSPTPMWNLVAVGKKILSYPKPFIIIDNIKKTEKKDVKAHDKAS